MSSLWYIQVANIAVLMLGDITKQSKGYLDTCTMAVSLITQDLSVY